MQDTAHLLYPSRCAICRIEGNATELYPTNLDFEAFNPAVFSARRLPDRIHYRIVRCNTCGLVRSDPVADVALLSQLYARSTFDYAGEVPGLQRTYGRYLAKLERYSIHKGALLEIGSGNGFFLETALTQGYERVQGVEPSSVAIAQAIPHIKPYLICDMMRPGLFPPESFDVICMFQVFDHVSDPGALLDECFRILKVDGMLLCLNHNLHAFSARLLKERSPIIDIEHTYLYDPVTISRLFEEHRFCVMEVGPVMNTYSLSYLVRLIPFPPRLKHGFITLIENNLLRQLQFTVPLGNLCIIARRFRTLVSQPEEV